MKPRSLDQKHLVTVCTLSRSFFNCCTTWTVLGKLLARRIRKQLIVCPLKFLKDLHWRATGQDWMARLFKRQVGSGDFHRRVCEAKVVSDKLVRGKLPHKFAKGRCQVVHRWHPAIVSNKVLNQFVLHQITNGRLCRGLMALFHHRVATEVPLLFRRIGLK